MRASYVETSGINLVSHKRRRICKEWIPSNQRRVSPLDSLELHSSSLVDVAEGEICVSEYLRLPKRCIYKWEGTRGHIGFCMW